MLSSYKFRGATENSKLHDSLYQKFVRWLIFFKKKLTVLNVKKFARATAGKYGWLVVVIFKRNTNI